MVKLQRQRPKPDLTLKIAGPGVRPGRISVHDLLTVCQHAQTAVNRQAAALEGHKTLRPGPPVGKVRAECELEVVSLGKGSAVLGFEQAKSQRDLPKLAGLGQQAIAAVVTAIDAMSRGKEEAIDPGVLDSLRSMGELFTNGVRSIEWVVPRRQGRGRIAATFNKKVQERVMKRLRPPTTRPVSLEGVLEMADFKPTDQKCRIHPPLGPAIACTFSPDLSDAVYRVLRQAARIEGEATVNAHTGKTESICIASVTPLDPLMVNAGNFFTGWSIDQLIQMQGIEPLRDLRSLAGGLPDDEDVDEMLADIYQRRA